MCNFFMFYLLLIRAVDPYGTGGTCPSNIYEGGSSMVMSLPQYFRIDVVLARFILSSNSNNCCLLYFNANIMCSFTKKASASGGQSPPDLYRGSAPGPRWGTFVPQTSSHLLCPPNNPVRSTPLLPIV